MLKKKGCVYYPDLGEFFLYFENVAYSSVAVRVPIKIGQKYNFTLKFFVKENKKMVNKCQKCPFNKICKLEKEAKTFLAK